MKPEVVYEVCRTRTTGPYYRLVGHDYFIRKPTTKQQRRKRTLQQCIAEEGNADDDKPYDNDVTSCSERSLPSIASWIDNATLRPHQRETRKLGKRTTTKIFAKPASKKGRVVYESKVSLRLCITSSVAKEVLRLQFRGYWVELPA